MFSLAPQRFSVVDKFESVAGITIKMRKTVAVRIFSLMLGKVIKTVVKRLKAIGGGNLVFLGITRNVYFYLKEEILDLIRLVRTVNSDPHAIKHRVIGKVLDTEGSVAHLKCSSIAWLTYCSPVSILQAIKT